MGRAAALILSLFALGLLTAGLIWAGFTIAVAARDARRRWHAGKTDPNHRGEGGA